VSVIPRKVGQLRVPDSTDDILFRLRKLEGFLTGGVAAGLADGDYGDISASGGGTILRVESAAETIFLGAGSTAVEIQAALDSLLLGGIVWLAPGVYTLSVPLTMNNANLTLRGSGRTATVLVYTADPNQDIITETAPSCTVEHLAVWGSLTGTNGSATPGTGRGIMLAIPDPGNVQNRRPIIRDVGIFATPSWCIFDPGAQIFDGQVDGAVPGNHWTIDTGVGGYPTPTLSGLAISIALTIEDCDIGFWGSNGGLFIGSGTAWPRIKGLKTNGYTFNTFSQPGNPPGTIKHDMGGVFVFNTLGLDFSDSYLQSPGDSGILPDKDAVTFSSLNGNSIWLRSMKFEVLGAATGCADSNGGAGGREFYFITAAGSHVTVKDSAFMTRMNDQLFGNASLSNWGTKVFRGENTAYTFRDCLVSHKRQRRTTNAGPLTTGDPEYFDYNDFMFLGAEGNASSLPTTIDNVVILNDLGGIREVMFPYPVPDVANCSVPAASTALTTTTGDFRRVNRGDVVSGHANIVAGTRVLYVLSTTAITLDTPTTGAVPFPTTLSFDPPSTSVIHRPNFRYSDRRWMKIGRFSSCAAPATASVLNCTVPGAGQTLTTTASFAALRAGMRITTVHANIRVNTKIFSITSPTSLQVDLPFLGGLGPQTIDFEVSDDDLAARWEATHEGSGGAVMGFVNSNDQDDGLWVRGTTDKGFRQIPFYRRRDSFVTTPMQGDLSYKTGDESLHTYSLADVDWKQVFSLKRTGSATGDLPYYSAANVPNRRAIGTADDLLKVSGGVPTWAAPDFKDSLLRISDDGDATKKLALEVSAITAGTTRTASAPNVPGLLVLAGNGADPPAAGAIGKVNRTAQVADIASTKLTDTTPAGLYVVSCALECTTADGAAGSVIVTFSWTDDVGATTQVLTQVLTATGRQTLTFTVYLASGNITYAVTHTVGYGTSQYALRVRAGFTG
jgi:hypothetical protein